MAIEITLMNDGHFQSYKHFAEKMFGVGSYQTKKDYFEWLMFNGRILLALNVADNSVIGFIHGISEQFCVDGMVSQTNVLLNLMVLPGFRNGIGAELIFKIFNRKECAFVLGTANKLGAAYKKIGMMQVPAFHYRKIYRPMIGGMKLLVSKLFNFRYEISKFDEGFKINNTVIIDGINFETRPNATLIYNLVKLANHQESEGVSQYWEDDFFKWRFFHAQGPKHLLIYLGEKSTPTDFLILSLGQVKGLSVLRVVLLVTQNTTMLQRLLQSVDEVAKQVKADVLLSMHADSKLATLYAEIGWKAVDSRAGTYGYLPGKRNYSGKFYLSAAAGDYGFEAIK